MDTLQCETLAAAADPLTQEIDLIEEAVSPYMRVLSEIACKGKVANATGVPHAITLADHGDAHKMIETSGLRRSTTEDVVEWMQREVWNVVKRNVESYHGVPGQLLQERPASFLQRQTVIWTDLDLGSIDTFILFSHALIFFESLTCCISCAVSTEPVNEICEPNDNLERINMLWDACIYLAAMALAHWETREGPNAAHAHFEHNIWEAFRTETRQFQYLSPEKYGAINALIRLVLRNLGGETNVAVEYWIKRFKDVSVKPELATEFF